MVKVLVVDDEVPIRQWMEFCINKMEGYLVTGTAANGAEGYSVFRKTIPDIVITDIRMPVMDGLEMLKMIQNIKPTVSTVVLTSHEDFEYARRAMKLGASEYILKTEITEESLHQLLEQARASIRDSLKGGSERVEDEVANRNHFLRSLVMSQRSEPVNEAMLKEYEICLDQSEFVALDVMRTEETFAKIAMPQEAILTHVIKVPLDLDHTVILGNIKRECSCSLGRQLELIRDLCRQLCEQMPCKIGCSDIYGKLGQIGTAMRQAYDRAQLGFYHPRENVFVNQKTGTYQITGGEKYKIIFSKELINQNFRQAIQIRNEMMAEARQEEVTDIEYLKKLYLFFMTSLLHITRDNIEKVESDLADIEREMTAAGSLDELDAVMLRGFESHGYGSTIREEYTSSVCNAIRYMEDHYGEPLMLTDVACHVALSAEYFSRLFKEETGVKFVVYLNNLRLKHALYLLETTNLKVYEIAEHVGYSNLSYFSTVFKKNFGQNPFDYKNRFKGSDERINI